jgi:hypothetical protein
MRAFPDFKNLQLVRNTKFSKFSQNLSFKSRDLRQRKSCCKLHKKSPKMFWLESENPRLRFGELANIDPEVKLVVKLQCIFEHSTQVNMVQWRIFFPANLKLSLPLFFRGEL